jgi:predicted dehydrogenase
MAERKTEIGVGLIGAGRMGSIRAHLASQNPAVNFLAIADADGSKASALADKTEASLHTDDNLAVIHHPQVDVVIVSTPEGEHTDAICEALALGKDVLVEKPLALSLVDADRILETLGQSSGELFVGYTQRLRRRFLSVREQISQGRLGEVVSARLVQHASRAIFRQIYQRAPHASPITDGLTYMADMALWFLEPRKPVKVYAQAAGVVFPDQPDGLGDYGWAIVTFDDGAAVNLGVTGILPEKWPAYVSTIQVDIFGTEGALAIDDGHKDVMLVSDKPIPSPYAPDSSVHTAFLGSQMPGDWALGDFYGPMREETRLFIDRVTTGRDVPLCDAERGREVLELTLAIEKSAIEGGSVVELPLRG